MKELRDVRTEFLAIAGLLLFLGIARADDGNILSRLEVEAHGFFDVRAGLRTQDDPNEKDASLGEARLQLDLQRVGDLSTLQLRADFLYDDVADDLDVDLETGEGFIDIREMNVVFTPLDFMDVKLGRQILTWGTGDLLFINDMFPKDWQSFLSGRDEEYLKAPSDAMFVSLFPGFADIDIAYIPRFDSDRYVSGKRLSFWSPMAGERVGSDAVVDPDRPDEWFRDDEIAIRFSRNLAGYELGAYLYSGFWKSPVGFDPLAMKPYYPRLDVSGISVRSGLGKGLINLEGGYYNSRDDSRGSDPFVPNDEVRGLIGYERELARELSVGVQYYIEHLQNYQEYLSTLPEGGKAKDENRHVTTLRVTMQALNQNLTISVFTFYSPSDRDTYIRPVIKYKASDFWLVTAGANVFLGEDDHTFFGQFERNSNVYTGLRYSF